MIEGLTTATTCGEQDLVRKHTAPSLNQKIDQQIADNIETFYQLHGVEIAKRIDRLNREWDIERYLEINASALAMTGLILGVTTGNKKWLAIPGAVLLFMLQHAVQGWCPPLPILRRLGVRTRGEIDREKYALKALRGDFGQEMMPYQAEGSAR